MNIAGTIPKSEDRSILKRKGTLLGGILLTCGSSIGVGILPLPILTGKAGSLPTVLIFLACGLYMTLTALLILETALQSTRTANFTTLARSSLNKVGQSAVFFSFLFLFYSLTTAYLAKGGELTHRILESFLPFSLPVWSGAVFLALLSGSFIILGPILVDYLNRIFFLGLLATYLMLAISGIKHFEMKNVVHADWSLSIYIIPFIISSFGWHNMIPSINTFLENDRKKSTKTILISAVVLFLIYVVWVVGLHGILPLEGGLSLADSFDKGEIVTEPLARMMNNPMIQYTALYMAFFAIITSMLGQGLSVVDFLSDALRLDKTTKIRILLCLALLLPTLFCSQFIPGIFFKALELGGGVAAMIVFGIIPACMCWVNRYKKDQATQIPPLVFGGKPMLIVIILLASFVISYEMLKNFFSLDLIH